MLNDVGNIQRELLFFTSKIHCDINTHFLKKYFFMKSRDIISIKDPLEQIFQGDLTWLN